MILTYNDNWVYSGNDIIDADNVSPVDPYNPLDLPPYTIRVEMASGAVPEFNDFTKVQVSSSPNIWDLTYENNNWHYKLNNWNNYLNRRIIAVLGANTTGVTDMSQLFMSSKDLTTIPLFDTSNVTDMRYMFLYCHSLTNIPQFDTHNVTDMDFMFGSCNSITIIPLLDTSNVTTMNSMFGSCVNVQSGALALYQQASSQTNPPTGHANTFYQCGSNTTTGAAELAQIPSDWK